MQYHASLITADGAYHWPVGSIMAIFSQSAGLPNWNQSIEFCVLHSLSLQKRKYRIIFHSIYTSANRTFPTPCNNEIFSGKIAIGYIHISHRKPVPPRYYTNISFDGVATVYSSILKILFSSLYSWFASHCFQLLADFSFCNSFATLKKKIFTILDHGVSSLWSESSRTGRCLHLIVNTALPQPPLY